MEEKSKGKPGEKGAEMSLEQMARDMSDALIHNPHLMDELSARLPTEFSFVLRQLPHDQEAMTNFVQAVYPLLEMNKRYNGILSEADKVALFVELMDKPEFISWIVQAITGRDAAEILEFGMPDWLSKSQRGADLLEQRQFEESKVLLLEALEECDKQRPNSLWSFAILRALAVACGGAGDVDKLEPLLKRWIDSAENKLGVWHPELAYPYSMMALVREEQGKVDVAEDLYTRAVKILEKTEPPDSEDITNALHELGFFYFRQQRWAEAKPLLERVLAAMELNGADEEEKIEYLEATSEIDARLKHFAGIEIACRRLLTLYESDPEEHPYSWYPMGLLACSFLAQEKFAEAAVVIETVMEQMSEAPIEENDHVALILNSYVELLRQSGREREASLVAAGAQRLIYDSLEIRTTSDEVLSDELPIEIIATCYYRLEKSDISDNWRFMASDEKSKLLREVLVEKLKEFFASTDFLKICTDFKEIEEEFQEQLLVNTRLVGLDIVFQFREFSDKGGFLQILGKLQRAIQLSDAGDNADAEVLYEEALIESARFPRSELKHYVREIYLDYLMATGQEARAKKLRNDDV